MKTHLFVSLPLFLLLTACPPPESVPVPPEETSEADTAVYAAYGTEPFWDIKIGPDVTIFSGLDIEERRFKTPDARPSFNGTRYPGSDISIDITRTVCNDGMSERLLQDTVTVQIGSKRYSGCGGATLPPEKLDDTSWIFEEIGGKPVSNGNTQRGNELVFSAGNVSGTVGCNRFSGAFKVSGNRLEVGPLRATRMACAGRIGEQEAMLFNLLGNQPEIGFDWLGHMTLKQGTTTIKLKRSY